MAYIWNDCSRNLKWFWCGHHFDWSFDMDASACKTKASGSRELNLVIKRISTPQLLHHIIYGNHLFPNLLQSGQRGWTRPSNSSQNSCQWSRCFPHCVTCFKVFYCIVSYRLLRTILNVTFQSKIGGRVERKIRLIAKWKRKHLSRNKQSTLW